jgi:DNA-binding MarR family transcriptional regulator
MKEHYIKTAIKYRNTMKKFNLKQKELASKLKVTKPTISNHIRILTLSKKVLCFAKKEDLSYSRCLLLSRSNKKLTDEQLIKIIRYNNYKKLSNRDYEKLIRFEVNKNKV